MRKLVLLLALVSISMSAQEYNRWSVGVELGMHAVGDESATVSENFNHYGLDIRYNLSERFAVGLYGGHDNLSVTNFGGEAVEIDYSRINFEGTVELFDLLHVYSNRFTMLGHGGPGIARINTPGYRQDVFNIGGGLTLLTKITDDVAFKLGYSGAVNINQDRTLDNYAEVTNAGINSVVSNLTAGFTFYLGKKKKHADWYVTPEPVYAVTYVTNEYITNNHQTIAKANCGCIMLEYIFFEHDKSDIKQSELNAITKVFTYLELYPNANLTINGYASATKSSAEYNVALSNRRAVATSNKLQQMGINDSRITITSNGKDYLWDDESIHDVARRVELIITKQ